jgi:hypothetical protein
MDVWTFPAVLGMMDAVIALVFAYRYKRWVYLLLVMCFLGLTMLTYMVGFYLVIVCAYIPLCPVDMLPLWVTGLGMTVVLALLSWPLLNAVHENEGMI